MLQRILVPTDGSEFSRQVLPLVYELAREHGAEAIFAQVVDFNAAGISLAGDSLGSPHMTVEMIDALETDARDSVSGLAERFRSEHLPARTAVLRGTVAASLLGYEADVQPDLIVMSSHARTGLARLVFGSVTDRLILEGNAPVMLIRTSVPLPSTLTRALVPLDGSPLAEEALLVVEMLASDTFKSLKLLRAVDRESERASAEAYLKQVAAGLSPSGVQVETEVRVGSPVEAIEAAAETVDVVIMATHGRGGLDRLRHGSVAQDITSRLTKPVIVQRPRLAKVSELWQFLSSVRLFSHLDVKLIERLAAFAHERSYAPGEVIVHEGDLGVGLFIIRSGRAEALERQDGHDVRLRLMGSGEVFGEIAVLEQMARTATVRALEPTTCLTINGLTLRTVLQESPETLKEFDATIAERLATHAPSPTEGDHTPS